MSGPPVTAAAASARLRSRSFHGTRWVSTRWPGAGPAACSRGLPGGQVQVLRQVRPVQERRLAQQQVRAAGQVRPGPADSPVSAE